MRALCAAAFVWCLIGAAFAQVAPADVIGDPVWLRKPDGDMFAMSYPRAALQEKTGGKAVLSCLVRGDGTLDCKVESETPEGMGFGIAAMNVSRRFQMAPKSASGADTAGRQVMLPIQFRIGNFT